MHRDTPSIIAATLLMLAPVVTANAQTDLEQGFANPPPSARPWVYWFWMDGNSSREGISADLEAMKAAGLGGVIMLEVDCGVAKGPVKYMSPPWREMFKHAVTEAARLGLHIDFNAGPGWTGNGGPWIKPEQSMQKLTFSEKRVSGPAHFDEALPQPPTKADFYRDVAVLAVPTPVGDFHIPQIDEKAMFHRNFYWAGQGAPSHIPLSTASAPADAIVPQDRIVDLTANLSADGRLKWDVPDGDWTIICFGRTSTGASTIPAPEAGIGLECDKLDAAAIDAHLAAHLGSLLADLPQSAAPALASIHVDSWEIGPQNWTGAFPQEFRRRRGYDLLPYLPTLTGRVVGSLEISERFLWDLRQTISELIVENNGRRLAAFAHARGMEFSLEAYDGTPCADLSFGGTSDVPMCEFWTNSIASWFSCLEAASIAHTNGRPIVAAEAFTANFEEQWRFHPGSIKAVGDWAFCHGVNRMVIHRYAHQPWLHRWPGITMGPWGIHFERTQTWWDMVPAFNAYLARCQYLLQQGTPVADICYLVPEGSPSVFRPPASAVRGDPPDHLGYSFDGISPEIVRDKMTVKDHRLVLPGGMSYCALVLPQISTMTPELLSKIAELVRGGATVIGLPPSCSPSLAGFPKCDDKVKHLADEMWGSRLSGGLEPAGPEGKKLYSRPYGAGRLFWKLRWDSDWQPGQPLVPPATQPAQPFDANRAEAELYCDFSTVADILKFQGLPPDFASTAELSSIHRRIQEADVYFVANRTPARAQAICAFRVTGQHPRLWDPMTGRTAPPLAYQAKGGITSIPLCLEPAQSLFVVFPPAGAAAADDPIIAITRDGQSILSLDGRAFTEPAPLQGFSIDARPVLLARGQGRYECRTASGTKRVFDVPDLPPPPQLTGPWQVRFQPQRGAPDKITLDTLTDWSKHPDPGVQHFSGVAKYTQEFTLTPELLDNNRHLFLDLGRVEVAARVTLNGQDLGALWIAPFRVDITAAARPGQNSLEIAVANLWCNRLIADAGLPEDQRLTWTTWNPFKPDTPLLESGLLGPVTINVAAVVPWP